MALFAVYDADAGKGGIYSYGRKNKNHPFVVNLDYQFDADELGAITDVDGIILVSYQDGSDFGVKATDPDNKATATYEGLDLKAPNTKKVNQITNWKGAYIFMSPLPAGCSVEVWYKLDKTGAFVQAKTDTGATSFSTANAQEAWFRVFAGAKIFEPRLVLNPSGNNTPEIYLLKVFFDE